MWGGTSGAKFHLVLPTSRTEKVRRWNRAPLVPPYFRPHQLIFCDFTGAPVGSGALFASSASSSRSLWKNKLSPVSRRLTPKLGLELVDSTVMGYTPFFIGTNSNRELVLVCPAIVTVQPEKRMSTSMSFSTTIVPLMA